jgi:hypothetical protein
MTSKTSLSEKIDLILSGKLRVADLNAKLDFGSIQMSSSSPFAPMYDRRFNPNVNNCGSTAYGKGNINVIQSSGSSMSRATANIGGFGGF